MSYIQQFKQLKAVCTEREMAIVEEMVFSAVDYVRAVIVMETTAQNLKGKTGDEYRDAVSSTDETRSAVHNGLITRVNIVNRVCANHGLPLIYTGDEQRRHYGDFALQLVTEIFNKRK